MAVIKQTNRTILFDAINPEKMDLFNLMAGVETTDKSLTDEKVKEINEQLLVKSFDEFLKKFAPTIYSYFDANSKKMVYALEKPVSVPPQLVKEIVIDKNNQFLKAFIQLIENKKSSKKMNVNFDYEAMLDALSPQKTLKDMKRIKKDVSYLAEESLKLESDSPARLKKLQQLSSKINESEKFYSEFPTQIALMIGTIKENLSTLALSGENNGEKAAPALPYFDGSGELKSLSMPVQSEKSMLLSEGDGATKLLVSEIEDRYNAIETARTGLVQSNDEQPAVSSLMCELVVSAFTSKMSNALINMDAAQKTDLYNNFSALYNTWQHDFIKIAKPIYERLLGVKMFFDQYVPKNKVMPVSLLVVNASLEDIAEKQNLEKLQLYLESVNCKTDFTNTIWYGIAPRIEMSMESSLDDIAIDMTPDFAQKWGYTGDLELDDMSFSSPMSSLETLLDGIKRYKIQTFFGFQTGEDTTFSKMAVLGADNYIEQTEEMTGSGYDEYAIACFPNITIVPEDKSRVVTSRKAKITEQGQVQFPDELKEDVKFWMKGVYIGAEYVAAGIVSAYQCPGYLKTYFKKAHPDFPGVRFDIEENENALRLPSQFAKEISGFTSSVKERVEQNKFGFVFSSDSFMVDGKSVSGITVLNARSMHMDKRAYRSIFQTSRCTYIERMLSAQLKNKDEKSIRAYFEPGGQISEWQKFGDWVNSIIRDGEKVELQSIMDGICDIGIESKGLSESIMINIAENE